MKDAGDKIPADDKKVVEDAVEDLKSVLSGDDLAAIKQKTEALQEASMKLGEHLYRAEQEASANSNDASEGSAEGSGDQTSEKPVEPEIVDAEFTEVDEQGNKKNKSAG